MKTSLAGRVCIGRRSDPRSGAWDSRVDHLVPDEASALVTRIKDEQGCLHVLVNNIWGATRMEWNKSVWESSLDYGLRTLRLAVDTHAITSHFAIPLLIKTPGGLVVEVTDGTDEYNAANYRVSFSHDLAKASVKRRRSFVGGHGPTAGRGDHKIQAHFSTADRGEVPREHHADRGALDGAGIGVPSASPLPVVAGMLEPHPSLHRSGTGFRPRRLCLLLLTCRFPYRRAARRDAPVPLD